MVRQRNEVESAAGRPGCEWECENERWGVRFFSQFDKCPRESFFRGLGAWTRVRKGEEEEGERSLSHHWSNIARPILDGESFIRVALFVKVIR